ncbi:hypothetical protein [Streptomyces sp. NBC_01618]|uniref:hypothetical protein n=1 Tax=Streptomyces sp. NBC_01618 TaxID=2975900 RepID=UPI0038681B5B
MRPLCRVRRFGRVGRVLRARWGRERRRRRTASLRTPRLTVALAALRTRWTTLIGTFVALALGVGLIAVMGLGLASTLGAPERAPQRFAGAPVVVMGEDSLTVEVRRGPSTDRVGRRLAHPHPVDIELLRDLRALGPVTRDDGNSARGGPDAVGVDAPADEVRRVVGDRALVLTGNDRRRADPAAARDTEGLVTVNALLGTAGAALLPGAARCRSTPVR